MKKFLAVILILTVMLTASGCHLLIGSLGIGGEAPAASGTIKAEDGYASGRIGDTLRTAFFDFTVKSAQFVDSYAGYSPKDGYRLIDVVISVHNILADEVPMYADDFQIQWGDEEDSESFAYPIAAADDGQAPEEYMLIRGGTQEYHHVFEVPEGYRDYSISFLETFEDGTEGNVFFIYFEL